MTDPPAGGGPLAPLSRPWVQASAAGALALAIYLRTLAPTVMWYDMGEFATASYVLGVAHNTGYPLLLLLGKLFTFLPIEDIAYRVNLMSAVFAALTVVLTYLIVFHLSARRSAAMLAALTLAFTSTLWSNATWATSYNLNAFLSALILLLLLQWRSSSQAKFLYAAVLTLGLGLGNHRLILGLTPAMAYLLWMALREGRFPVGWRRLLLLAGLFLLGFSVNLYLPIRAAQDPPVNWGDPSTFGSFLRMVTTGYARAFVNPFESVASMELLARVLTIFPLYEFTAPGLILTALGAVQLGKRRPAILILTALVAGFTMLMVSVYGIHNIFNYFQPIYLVFAVWLGLGAGAILAFVERDLGRRLQFTFLTPARRRALATAVLLTLPLLLLARSFNVLDRSQHLQARDFARYLLSRIETDSALLADFWSWAPLAYVQVVEGQGTGIGLTNALSQSGLDQQGLVDQLLADGVPTYLVVSSEDSPRLQVRSSNLYLLAPYVVYDYPTARLPLPEYKDLLVPRGSVYRAVAQAPDLSVTAVPTAHELAYNFGGEVELLGFELHPTQVRPGDPFQATYYWRLPQATTESYWTDVLFTDVQGRVTTLEGFPLFLHSHWLGGGALPTHEWSAGTIMREQYDGLVPRSAEPGVYRVSALIYTGPERARLVPLLDGPGPASPAVLGSIEVLSSP